MANVAHKNLTGTDLHEPKGVAAASANTVYVANGSGSGSWGEVTNSVLATAAKAFQGSLLHVQDQKTSGTNGGTFTSGAWRTRDLNTTLTNEISGASLGSNVITLPAGTYFVIGRAPAFGVSRHSIRLYNTTDGAALLYGAPAYEASSTDYGYSHITGRFTIAGSKNITLQHICQGTVSSNGFGVAVGSIISVPNEVYSDLMIWKVA